MLGELEQNADLQLMVNRSPDQGRCALADANLVAQASFNEIGNISEAARKAIRFLRERASGYQRSRALRRSFSEPAPRMNIHG